MNDGQRATRTALIAALAVNVLLIGALGYAWSRGRSAAEPAQPKDPSAVMVQPATSAPALASVQLSPQRLQQIGVTTALVRREPLTTHLRAMGNVAVDQGRVSYVQLRFAGWIQHVFASTPFQHVRQGDRLFTIYSPDLITTERDYLLARQNAHVMAGSSVPGVSQGAASLLDAAAERLRQWNVPAREIEALDHTGQVRQTVEIDSPASGYITERTANPQMYAQPDTRLYTIADLSAVWVYANVPQNDIAHVHVGAAASITVDAYPGRTFRGRVDQVWPQVDEATRTVKLRLVLPNPGTHLMPGMFVNVDFTAPLGRAVVVPASAVFHTGTRAIAFVDHGGGLLEPREIQPGQTAGDTVAVLRGLQPGERVVTSANFLIDSESQLQAALGSFTPPPPGAGAAASMNQPAPPEATLRLTTEPSPPRRGQNTLRVTLNDTAGRPVSGAHVEVTFSMPAMPAMGMAAMTVRATPRETAPGQYTADMDLPTGGTWQVATTARHNGTIIATQHSTMSATGGI